jgi:hypothetical protein
LHDERRMKKAKLRLTRETLRSLSVSSLAAVASGAAIQVPTRTCYCTIIPNSVVNSCYQSDCCLFSVDVC